jgi:hypothetical protein
MALTEYTLATTHIHSGTIGTIAMVGALTDSIIWAGEAVHTDTDLGSLFLQHEFMSLTMSDTYIEMVADTVTIM